MDNKKGRIAMSINAISSVSLYEYYFTINKKEKEKEESPLAEKMREYGLVPTDNEVLNAALLKKAQEKEAQKENENQEMSYSKRPWADIMYQLNITFNENPKDDIEDIKDEIKKLTMGLEDEELNQEMKDLEDYVESLYISYQTSNVGGFSYSNTLNSQLDNLAIMNRATI